MPESLMTMMDRLYHSEINFLISALWDGGFVWYLAGGCSPEDQVDNAHRLHCDENPRFGGEERSFAACLEAIKAAALRNYPDSVFARETEEMREAAETSR